MLQLYNLILEYIFVESTFHRRLGHVSYLPASFTKLSYHKFSSGHRADSVDFMTRLFLLSLSVFCFLVFFYPIALFVY